MPWLKLLHLAKNLDLLALRYSSVNIVVGDTILKFILGPML